MRVSSVLSIQKGGIEIYKGTEVKEGGCGLVFVDADGTETAITSTQIKKLLALIN